MATRSLSSLKRSVRSLFGSRNERTRNRDETNDRSTTANGGGIEDEYVPTDARNDEDRRREGLLSDHEHSHPDSRTKTATTSRALHDDAMKGSGGGSGGGDDVEKKDDDDDDDDDVGVSFLRFFLSSDGPPQIVFVCFLISLSFGSTIGVVPAVMMDQYARLSHGYDGPDCSSYVREQRPPECASGSDDAQSASSVESFVNNILTFFTSSMMGSVSDSRGRKGVLILGLCLSLIGPVTIVWIQLDKSVRPFWYYAGRSLSGLVGWLTVALSCLSDVVPARWRAPSYGLLFAGFSVGFFLGPTIAVPLGHFRVSVLSLVLSVVCVSFVAFGGVPETLPPELSRATLRRRREEAEAVRRRSGGRSVARYFLSRPFRELSILNRSRLFRSLSALAFLSGVVSSADQSLLLYYLENRFAFDDRDVAVWFAVFGTLSLYAQCSLLPTLNAALGERGVLVVGFAGGVLTNVVYGTATDKATVFLGALVGPLTVMTFPVVSAIKANNVEGTEQGRIQGALSSLRSLSSALGPVALNYVYGKTKDGGGGGGWSLGPGTMFLVAGALDGVAVWVSTTLPKEETNSRSSATTTTVGSVDDDDEERLESGGGTSARASYGSMES